MSLFISKYIMADHSIVVTPNIEYGPIAAVPKQIGRAKGI
jgi:hypothetical protein